MEWNLHIFNRFFLHRCFKAIDWPALKPRPTLLFGPLPNARYSLLMKTYTRFFASCKKQLNSILQLPAQAAPNDNQVQQAF